MAIIHGRNLLVLIDGVAVAGARSCELYVEADEIEKSSSTQGQWREHVVGRKSWSVTCSHLVSEIENSVDMVGEEVMLRFQKRGSNDYVQGYASVKSWKCTGTIPNLSQGSYEFSGNGVLG